MVIRAQRLLGTSEYLYQSVEWPSLVCYDYDVTKVCRVDRLPITDFRNEAKKHFYF